MKRFEQVVGAVISCSVAWIIISIAWAVFTGCGSHESPVEQDGPHWYELYWTEDEQGQRYMNLCRGVGTAREECHEVSELPDGCTVSVDSDDEIRCEKEVR